MENKLVGNKFWKLRTKHGRDKIFSDAAVLTAEAQSYFDWCDRHPWEKVELVKYRGGYEEAGVPLGRPYTMDGFTYYLGVSGSYFRTAKGNLREKIEKGKADESEIELLEAIELIEQVIRMQNIEGAAVGLFSTNLVARIHNIAENVNNNNSGEAVLRVSVRDQQTADNLDALDDLL